MKKLLGLIFNPWVLIAVALLALALVIWIIGPLVAIGELRPLQTERSRWITIGVDRGAGRVVRSGWNAWRARHGNAAVVNQLMAAPRRQGGPARAPISLPCASASSARCRR